MNRYYIVMDYSTWGGGTTLDKATKNIHRAGGMPMKTFVFESELPFAPSDREATDDEADVYVTRYGELVSIRCNLA